MNKVKRAIIMAAGYGHRMEPVTKKIPKPMVSVNGVRMIDSVIEGLIKNDISDIYIVVGYKKEYFNQLLEEYSDININLIENPFYDTCNNVSSLYCARNYLENSIILDGDQLIYDSSILSPYFNFSGYNCIWTDKPTKEWVLELDSESKIVRNCYRDGHEYGWQLYSISRWNREDGKRLKKHLEIEFEKKKNTQIYWDDVPLFCYPEEYTLSICPIEKGSVVEIDDFNELVTIDPTYREYR